MNISAIICEYNPLHNGHKYQIDLTRELTKCDGLIAIMSGNFVQRGEPALIDKWTRTAMALKNGIDLVIELPAAYAISSAETFAKGAVSILDDLKIIGSLSFGSETGKTKPLMEVAKVLSQEPDIYKDRLKTYLAEGYPFPSARSKALGEYFSLTGKSQSFECGILETSNNILGIEYCKSIIQNKSQIIPVTIERRGGDYNNAEITGTFSSATAVRKLLKENLDSEALEHLLPASSLSIIMQLIEKNYDFTYPENVFDYIRFKAAVDINETMKGIPDTGEGLYKRVYKALLSSSNMEEAIQGIKTKRYTYTRISRILAQYFIGFERFSDYKLSKQRCSYVRVLGFNPKGAEILKEIKSESNLTIITKVPKNPEDPMLQLDLVSTRAYSIINRSIRYNEDYL
ncbi:MAG: nucleotidyltransferase, partial [Bacillota bacterium]|nr:nucleotidyltransferase [Bacillota bacterium]